MILKVSLSILQLIIVKITIIYNIKKCKYNYYIRLDYT